MTMRGEVVNRLINYKSRSHQVDKTKSGVNKENMTFKTH